MWLGPDGEHGREWQGSVGGRDGWIRAAPCSHTRSPALLCPLAPCHGDLPPTAALVLSCARCSGHRTFVAACVAGDAEYAEGRGGFAASSTLRDRRLLDRPAPPIRPTLYLQIQQHLPYAEGVVELLARAHSRLPSSSSLCCPPTRRRSPQAPVRWPRSRRSSAPTLLDSSRSTDASCARRCLLPERRLRPTRNRTRGRPICFTIFALA